MSVSSSASNLPKGTNGAADVIPTSAPTVLPVSAVESDAPSCPCHFSFWRIRKLAQISTQISRQRDTENRKHSINIAVDGDPKGDDGRASEGSSTLNNRAQIPPVAPYHSDYYASVRVLILLIRALVLTSAEEVPDSDYSLLIDFSFSCLGPEKGS